MNEQEIVWQKATASNISSCIEVAKVGGSIAVRDSKDPTGGMLRFNRHEIAAFLDGAKAGEFDHFAA